MGERVARTERRLTVQLTDQRGIALLITILMLSLLVVVTMEYHRNTWRVLLDSSSFMENYRLRAMADSGINIGLGILSMDATEGESDSFLDKWATVDAEMFAPLFSRGRLELKILDQTGLLPINSLVPPTASGEGEGAEDNSEALQVILLQLLASGKFAIEDETAMQTVIDSLVDWLDSDDEESEFGAEESYYRSLEPAYGCRNGAVQSIEELLLVRGITPELLYGAGDKEGLIHYITVAGTEGKINLNTAPVNLVQSMNPLLDEQMVAGFDEFRRAEENQAALAQANWYASVSGWPGDIVLDEKILTTVSRNFRITAIAGNDARQVTVTSDIERGEDGTMKLLRKTVE